jgi:hypothetical protein
MKQEKELTNPEHIESRYPEIVEKIAHEKETTFAIQREERDVEDEHQKHLQKTSIHTSQELADIWKFIEEGLSSLSADRQEEIKFNTVKIAILHSQYPGIVEKTFMHPNLLCRLCDLASTEPNDTYRAIVKDDSGILIELLAENSSDTMSFIYTIGGRRALELVNEILGLSSEPSDDASETLSDSSNAQPEGVPVAGEGGCREFGGCVLN